MVLLFEVAGPFRWKPKVERAGALTRIIWGWFSLARIAAGFNDISWAFREDERQQITELCEGLEQRGMFDVETVRDAIRMRSNASGKPPAANEPNKGNEC